MASFSPEPQVPGNPLDHGVVPVVEDELLGVMGDRVERVVVDLRAGDDRHVLVEQAGQGPDHAGLGLPPLAEEDHVVAGQDGVLQLGQHGVLVAQHTREQGLAGPDPLDGVGPDLLLHRSRDPSGLAERADGRRAILRSVHPQTLGCVARPGSTRPRGAGTTAPAARAYGGRVEFRPRGPAEGDLNGTWRVHPLDDELRRIGADDDLDDRSWWSLEVPGHWGRHPELEDHDGPLLYRRRFPTAVPRAPSGCGCASTA